MGTKNTGKNYVSIDKKKYQSILRKACEALEKEQQKRLDLNPELKKTLDQADQHKDRDLNKIVVTH